MSQQLNLALADVDAAMSQLRAAIKGIPARREGFKQLHDTFARSVSTLITHMSYARCLLDEEAQQRRRRRRAA
jgi:hypothetical protein